MNKADLADRVILLHIGHRVADLIEPLVEQRADKDAAPAGAVFLALFQAMIGDMIPRPRQRPVQGSGAGFRQAEVDDFQNHGAPQDPCAGNRPRSVSKASSCGGRVGAVKSC